MLLRTSKSPRISRRALLRGAGGVALALPFLEAMETRAADPPFPKRLIVFFTNNGTVKSAWRPQGSETSFQLGPILEPLEPFQSELLVLEGIDQESSYHGPGSGDPHMPGMAHLLTGTEMVDTGPGTYDKMGGGISVDQHIAQALGASTKFPSLHFGVIAREYQSSPWNSLSYAGANMPVEPEDDPVKQFNRIFGDITGDPGTADTLKAQRLSVLDAVQGELHAVRGKLGGADRVRLDQHLASIEQLQNTVGATIGGCTVPVTPSPVATHANDNAPLIMKAQSDLLVASLACDMTRVTTLQWHGALGGKSTFTWLGQSEEHHEISHKGDGDATGQQQMTAVNTWFAEQLAYLLGALKAVPEGSGSLLDSTVVVWVNELSAGNAHSRRDMPFVLAGSCGGYFKTGRFMSYAGAFHNDLLVSLCHAMDVPVSTFGNPAYCTGPLPGLT